MLAINGMPLRDFFDLEFYASEYRLEIDYLSSSGDRKHTTILRETAKTLGIEPEPYQCRNCTNHCLFCFIDQMPPGLRPSLYHKDDDYLYSYAFGNYITLNNLTPNDRKRIIEQHISPLYVSVHTTSNNLRAKLMGYQKDFDILRLLRYFSKHGIEFHFQIVCVPRYNCGEELLSSLTDLTSGDINTLSIGVVPVGLTRFRQQLTLLKPCDRQQAKDILRITEQFKHSDAIVQAADELFIKAGEPIPELAYYGSFPQLENGIGMLRLVLANFKRKKRSFAKELQKYRQRYLMLTSTAAFPTVSEIAATLNQSCGEALLRVQMLSNRFFGEQITVSGLLTAGDVISQCQADVDECIILPSNIFNHDGFTLDDYSQTELKTALQRELLIVEQTFEDWEWV